MVDAQCASQDHEVELLRQVLARSTKVVAELRGELDGTDEGGAERKASWRKKIFGK